MQEQHLTKTRARRRTRPRRTEDDKREGRCDERVLLDRVALIVSERSPGGPPDDAFWDRPKPPRRGPGPAGAQNHHCLNSASIEKEPDWDGRRIQEFRPLGTRPDLVPFRVPPGIVSRVGFLVLDGAGGACHRDFLNLPLDTSIGHFIFWCPEVGLEFVL